MVRLASVAIALASLTGLAGAQPGALPVTMESRADLPGFTIYRPANLHAVKGRKLPILAWANGGCANLGNSAQPLLTAIAAQGYLVVAIGPIGTLPQRPGTPSPPPALSPEAQLRARVAANGNSAPTRPEQLREAIDWAQRANRVGPFAGRIDPHAVAVAGHSCGGLQAIAAASDPRVKTTIALNSGVFDQPRVKVDKTALDRLHGPIAYFIGGPGDIAYVNAEDDFRRITKVPAFKANNEFGHGGRLRDAGGGPTAQWVIRWLDWRLKGDKAARRAFAGAECGLCRQRGWAIERKGID